MKASKAQGSKGFGLFKSVFEWLHCCSTPSFMATMKALEAVDRHAMDLYLYNKSFDRKVAHLEKLRRDNPMLFTGSYEKFTKGSVRLF